MKEFFRMSFATVNYLLIAIHSLTKELPSLVELAINETKKLFEDEKPPTRGRKTK